MKPYSCLLLFPLALASQAGNSSAPAYHIETVAGSSNFSDGGLATAAQIGNIQGIAIDPWGNVYLSDTDHHRVRKVSTAGIITTVAGTGAPGFSGDGGPAPSAQLNLPYGLAADFTGAIYIADLGNNRVRRIAPDGTITTYAGTGAKGSTGDGGAATSAQLMSPRNLAVDSSGNLYISEFAGHRVRKVTPAGIIYTAAGNGTAGSSGDGGLATNAQIASPAGLAIDRNGVLYIADSQNQRVRRVASGVISTYLGGTPGTALQTPIAVACDTAGTVYVADGSYTVRSFTAAGKWSNVAGLGAASFSGDGGPALNAGLTNPRDLAVDPAGDLYIADGVRVREIDSAAVIHTVAGDGYLHAIGDGATATAALLSQPSAVALDSAGNLYIADPGTGRVRVVSSGVMQTLAGTGDAAYDNDGVPASSAALNSPVGVAVDAFGSVVIADTNNHRIRQVWPDGTISTRIGTGTAEAGPGNTLPLETALNAPRGVCGGRTGTIFVVDTLNQRVLRAPAGALVQVFAGNGAAGNAGDGGPAPAAQLNQPGACALDSAGDLFIADTLNHRIRKVTPDGVIHTVAGTGASGNTGDEGPATSAKLNTPAGVAVDDGGDIFIADSGNHRIRQVTPDGVIHTIAGTGAAGFSGDGGDATSAALNSPSGLVLDGSGDLYFADTNNNRIRRLIPMAQSPAPPDPIVLPPTFTAENAASLAQGPVAPGEIVSIFGTGMGPDTGVTGVFDATGQLATQLSGTQVLFDGVAAPLFYAQSSQVNAQAPYTIAGDATTHVEIYYQSKLVGSMDLPLVAAGPALFPAVVNQDGSGNAQSARAAAGSIVTFYATGEGLTDGPNRSGQPAQAPYPRPLLPVALTIGGVPAKLFYAGSAPGEVGVMQVNAQIPAGQTGQASVVLSVGGFLSPTTTIWLQ